MLHYLHKRARASTLRFLRVTLYYPKTLLSTRISPAQRQSNTELSHAEGNSSNQPTITTGDSQQWRNYDFLFKSTRYRYVSNEAEELQQRYIEFDVEELSKQAAHAVGSRHCVSITKSDDGSFNRVLVLEMDDGKQVIAKIPTPNAGPIHEVVASEVATMEFVRNFKCALMLMAC